MAAVKDTCMFLRISKVTKTNISGKEKRKEEKYFLAFNKHFFGFKAQYGLPF